MKILAVHNAYHKNQDKRPAVDAWRIARPLAELRKHVGWQIDERPTIIPHLEQYKNPKEFTEAEMEAAFTDVCTYDVVFSSYHANTSMYTLLQVANKRAQTQYVMDVDDDMFAINPDNPVWAKVTDENVYHMQRMIANNPWISTTTEVLARVLRDRRPGHASKSVMVNPNYITDAYKHPEFDNKERLVIGFFGGSSHYGDLHRTGVLEAVERIMHEHKHVHFKSVGMPIDKYLPKSRVEEVDGQRGDGWIKQLFPSLHMDIALGPLEDNLFNRAKSDIKWQEATRAGAAFIASNIGPYRKLLPGTALLCRNTADDWYRVLQTAVTDADKRRTITATARQALQDDYRLEDNWRQYETMFQNVLKYKEKIRVHRPTGQKSTVL